MILEMLDRTQVGQPFGSGCRDAEAVGRQGIHAEPPLGIGLKFSLTFVLPVLLAVNIPARYGMLDKSLDLPLAAYFLVSTGVALSASRWFFRYALKAYRSASS